MRLAALPFLPENRAYTYFSFVKEISTYKSVFLSHTRNRKTPGHLRHPEFARQTSLKPPSAPEMSCSPAHHSPLLHSISNPLSCDYFLTPILSIFVKMVYKPTDLTHSLRFSLLFWEAPCVHIK